MLMDTVISQIAKVDSVAVMNLKEEIVMANAFLEHVAGADCD